VNEMTDAAAVAATLSGDGDAFAHLVRNYQDRAYGTAVGILSDFELARDVVQDSFLLAWRDLAKLEDPERFGAWLRGIVRNTAYRRLRDRRAQVAAEPLSDAAELHDESASPERLVRQKEERRMVQCALQRTNEKNREVLGLHYVRGLSYVDIASFLGITEAAVIGRMQRARRELEKELAMVEKTFKDNAPDDAFAQRVAESIKVFTAKGPAEDHMHSPWFNIWHQEVRSLLASDEEGFAVAVAMSNSENAKVRTAAALHFGLTKDPRGKKHLLSLMNDKNAIVRQRALRWYASDIHPAGRRNGPFGMAKRAESVAEGVSAIIPMLDDPTASVRHAAVCALSAYVGLRDASIDAAMKKALADPKHKIAHYAAGYLGIACPTCGKTNISSPNRPK
jgi:RNA polymerase sigma-70 factor, ECF subfamily